MTTAIVLAAGKSERMGSGVDKAFLSLVDKPMVAWSLITFERCPLVDRIILVVRKEQLMASKAVVKMFGISKIFKIVAGGNRRQDSVQAGIGACDFDTKIVVIHDAARPCVTSEMIESVVTQAKRVGAVTLGRPVIDTVKFCEKGLTVSKTISREKLWTVQTPQAFQFRVLRDAMKNVGPAKDVTDECQTVELAGQAVKIVECRMPNIKVTTAEDIQVVTKLLK